MDDVTIEERVSNERCKFCVEIKSNTQSVLVVWDGKWSGMVWYYVIYQRSCTTSKVRDRRRQSTVECGFWMMMTK